MIKQSFLGAVAVAAAAIVLGVTGNAQSAKADTTTHATVTFTLPADSKIEIKSMPNIDFGTEQVNTSGQVIDAKKIDNHFPSTTQVLPQGGTLTWQQATLLHLTSL